MNYPISKILIVDDSILYLSLLKTILKDVEAEVYMANSGKEALELIKENDFALDILDIQMPEMDGFELAVRIRNMPDRDLAPIIFLTAYFSDEFQMFKGYDTGAIDYLTKPVNKTVFISKVKIFLELDRQKRSLIISNDSLQKSKIELERKQDEIELQNKVLRKAQFETEESRRKFIKLYDFAPAGYFTINKGNRILEINRMAVKLFGIETTNLIDRDFKEFIAEEMHPDLDDFLTQVFENKSISGCEIKLKPVNGRAVFVHLEGSLIDENQKCLLSMVDVTDRVEAQIALYESEELYHSLLKTSPDGIILTDLRGQIIEASDIAIELLGNNNRTNLEGKHFIHFIPKESRRTLIKILQRTAQEGMVQNHEIKLNRIDLTVFTGEISASQIKGNKGELKAFMAVIRDITERKNFEKQLRHSERMAGIGELATGMAHEINQPLNTISLSIDNILFLLDNNSLTETYLKTKINKVFANITRIKKIIDHVRTFSRDQDDFIQSNFEINKSIRNSISMISEQILRKEIKLTFNPDKNVPTLKGNSYRFEQVILNMLINAKDAIEEKKKKNYKNFEKKIDLSTKLIEKQIIIEIKDNGIGIKSEDIEKVLNPFFTTKPPGKGTGLGLSISYAIIKELGGEIEIQSTPQIGTSILIKIPVQSTRINRNHYHDVQ
ncbi:MAG: PAS domain S-box protein [Bacteroidota bacterium]|nr:PAS domain S-box protein [Bacteroidota bacterium]